jgi:hypothetical protein
VTTETVETVRVQAQAFVLGLAYGEIAELPVGTRDLDACLSKGLVVALDVDGKQIAPPAAVFDRPGGCGCSKR